MLVLRAVLVTDLAAAAVGLALAYAVHLALVGGLQGAYLWSAVGAPSWLVGLALARAYDRRCLGAGPEEYRRVLRAGVGAGVAAAVLSYAGHLSLSRGFVLLCCGFVSLLTLLGRSSVRLVLRRARQQGRCLYNVLLVGEEAPVLDVLRQVRREQSGGLRVVGACVPSGRSSLVPVHGVPVLGDLHDAAQAVRRFDIDTVAVTACAALHGPHLRRLSWDLEGTGVDLVVAPGLVEVAGPRLHIRPLCGLPLLHVEEPELAGGRRLLKGVADRLVAALALVLASPLLLLIALAVRIDSPGPVLFRQARAGRARQTFWMYKIRTMHQDADLRLAALRHHTTCTGTRCCSRCATTRGSPAWDACCAATPWTSSRSCSTCSWGRCRSSGPVRRCCPRWRATARGRAPAAGQARAHRAVADQRSR